MNRLLLCTILIFSFSIFCYSEQSLLLLPVEAYELDMGSLASFEVELNSKFSTLFDFEVVVGEELEESLSRFYFESSITTKNEMYSFKYIFYDQLKASIVEEGEISFPSLNEILEALDNEILKIRSILRKPPVVVKSDKIQMIIQADVPGVDIYVNSKFIGISPVNYFEKIGVNLSIEGRTESLKKILNYVVTEEELKVISLELEPIVGSFLLRGDLLGRTLYINGEPFDMETTSLFKNIPIGLLELKIENEWSSWEDKIFIEEDKLLSIEVAFDYFSTATITIIDDVILRISNIDNSEINNLTEDYSFNIKPGEYIFTTYKEGYVTEEEYIVIETDSYFDFSTPTLEKEITEADIALKLAIEEAEIERLRVEKSSEIAKEQAESVRINKIETDIIDIYNSRLAKVREASFWGSVGSGGLLLLGIIGEFIIVDMYNNETVSQNAIEYRERGESIRLVNIALLSTGILSLTTNLISNNQFVLREY